MSIKPKKPTPAERWSQLVNGRLTNKQIFDLFDEFGMAKRLQANEDYDWVRHNLPNIPEEMKKILKIELDKENARRKSIADEQKESQKPKKEQPQNTDGEGGPTQSAWESAGNTGVAPFSGSTYAPSATIGSSPYVTTNWTTSPNISLVRFTSDPNGSDPGDASTVWYVDHSTNTFRPIMSAGALRDLYPDNNQYQAAINSISVVGPQELQPGGQLANFIDLGTDYGIFEKQQSKKLDFNPIDLKNSYGQVRNQDADTAALRRVNSFITFLGSNNSGINNSFLTKIKSDPVVMALYINAFAYGGYSPNDLYQDIKRRELVGSGNKSLENISIISPNITKKEYSNTSAGQRAANLPMLTPPPNIGNISTEVWDSPATALNDDYYRLLDPSTDPKSQSFKDAMEAIKPDFYDHVLQALSAQTEVDKAAADSQWKDYVSNLEKTYGYKFSDNALTAWNELQTIEQNAIEAGLSGSGIEQEKIDEKLRATRLANEKLREEEKTTESSKLYTNAKANFSPEEIKKMNDEDAAAGLPRTEWRMYKAGLVPATAINQAAFIADFKSKHPDLAGKPDSEIKEKYYDPIYDENGNMRSTLFQNQFNNSFKIKYGYDPNSAYSYTDKDTGLTVNSIQSYKENEVIKGNLAKEAEQQKDITKVESGDYFNPTKGAEIKDYSINQGATGPAAPTTPAAPADKKISVKDRYGNLMNVYESSLPALKAEGSLWDEKKTPALPKIEVPKTLTSGEISQKQSPGIPTGSSTSQKATVWLPGKPTSKKVVTVGDPNAFTGGYQLYTGK